MDTYAKAVLADAWAIVTTELEAIAREPGTAAWVCRFLCEAS